MEQMQYANIAAIPCHKKNYGVGYTQLIDTLPYSIPILMTYNDDIPLNIEKLGIGFLIPPYDIDKWCYYIDKLKNSPETVSQMGAKARDLVHTKYNADITYQFILNDIHRITTI